MRRGAQSLGGEVPSGLEQTAFKPIFPGCEHPKNAEFHDDCGEHQ
jgi:hypothetical protein